MCVVVRLIGRQANVPLFRNFMLFFNCLIVILLCVCVKKKSMRCCHCCWYKHSKCRQTFALTNHSIRFNWFCRQTDHQRVGGLLEAAIWQISVFYSKCITFDALRYSNVESGWIVERLFYLNYFIATFTYL